MGTVEIFTFCDIKPEESFLRCLLLWVAVCWAACVTGRLRIWIGHWLTGLFSAADSKLLTTALKQMVAITNISQFSSSCSIRVNAAVIHGSRDREIRNTITLNLNLSRALCRGPARSGNVSQVSHEPAPGQRSTHCMLWSLYGLYKSLSLPPILAPNQ